MQYNQQTNDNLNESLGNFNDVIGFFIHKLNMKLETDDSQIATIFLKLYGNSKDQYILDLTNGRIKFWKSWIMPKGDDTLFCSAFAVNNKPSQQAIGLDKNDKFVLIISDVNNKNFFAVDVPREWTIEERKGEQYKFYKVNDEDEIIEVNELKDWDELLKLYNCDKGDELPKDFKFIIRI